MDCVGWSMSDCRLTTVGRSGSTPAATPESREVPTSRWYLSPSPRYMSSRMPMASVRKLIMLAVSRTVSPWAIWLLPSSRSWMYRPSRSQALAKEKRVRVELSRKLDTAMPESQIFALMLLSRRPRRMSATRKVASISSRDFSQVRRKSLPTMSIFLPLSSAISFAIPFLSIRTSNYHSYMQHCPVRPDGRKSEPVTIRRTPEAAAGRATTRGCTRR